MTLTKNRITGILIIAAGAFLLFYSLPRSKPFESEDQRILSSEDYRLKVTPVVKGLEHPWDFAFLPDGGILLTEREGRLRLVHDGVLQAEPVAGLPEIAVGGQGGLLGLALHPDFASNHLVYFSYSAADKEGNVGTEVARAVLQGNRLNNLKVIFRARPKTDTYHHFGSRLLFHNGHLYITLGEKFQSMHEAQNPSNHLGSIIRLNPDGSVPEDNPFVGQPDKAPEIYSWGNRNVQGIAVNPASGEIWFHEHGPRGGDEVNLLEAGANYGWPEVTHGIGYDYIAISDKTTAPGMKDPLLHWTPSIAPSGMTFYTGDAFPEWRGDLFAGALAGRHLRRVSFEGSEPVGQEELLEELEMRIRQVRTGPDGFLYVINDDPEGMLLKIEPVE